MWSLEVFILYKSTGLTGQHFPVSSDPVNSNSKVHKIIRAILFDISFMLLNSSLNGVRIGSLIGIADIKKKN